MKKRSKLIIVASLVACTFCFIPQFSMAQIIPPDTDPDLPIDGGITVLIAAGIGFGIKKIRDERKKQLNKLP